MAENSIPDPFAGYAVQTAPSAPAEATADPFSGYSPTSGPMEQPKPEEPGLGQRALDVVNAGFNMGHAAVKAVVGENEFDYPEVVPGLLAGRGQAVSEATLKGGTETALGFLSKLNRARGEAGMIDVLHEQDPNLKVSHDKFGNPIVNYFGKNYYLNRGGLSRRDVTEGMRDTLIAMSLASGAGAATAALALPVRAGAQAGAGLFSSILSDLVSWGAGSKQGIDLGAAVGGAVGGAGAEIAGSAVSAAVNRVRTNPARFLQRDGSLTEEGRNIFAEAGIDPNDVSDKIAAQFASQAKQTGPIPGTARAAAAGEFGVPLTRGQAMSDYDRIAFEQAAKRGARGQVAADITRGQFSAQDEAIAAAKIRIGEELAPNVPAKSQQDAAGIVLEAVRGQERAHGEMVRAAYEQAAEAAKGVRIPKTSLDGLPQAVRQDLARAGVRLRPDSRITPASNEMMAIIEETGAGIVPEATVPSGNAASNLGVAMKAMETVRKELAGKGGLYESALKSSPTDARAAGAIKRGFDRWLDGVFDDAAMSGVSPEALQQFKNARAAASKHFELFGQQAQRIGTDDAGSVIERMVNNDVTEQEVANFLYGSSKVGDSGRAYLVAKRLANIFGRRSDAWDAVKLGMWQRMTTAAEGVDQPSAQQISKNIMEFVNGRGRALARELYTPTEIAKMKRFATVLKMTIPPPQAVNYSASGYELARLVGGMRFYSGPLYLRIFDQTRNASSMVRALSGGRPVPLVRPRLPSVVPAAGVAIGGRIGAGGGGF